MKASLVSVEPDLRSFCTFICTSLYFFFFYYFSLDSELVRMFECSVRYMCSTDTGVDRSSSNYLKATLSLGMRENLLLNFIHSLWYSLDTNCNFLHLPGPLFPISIWDFPTPSRFVQIRYGWRLRPQPRRLLKAVKKKQKEAERRKKARETQKSARQWKEVTAGKKVWKPT